MKKYLSILLMLFIFTLPGCLTEKNQIREPLWGKESCSRCRMILSEKRFSAQRVFTKGEPFFYDDINCALMHKHSRSDGTLYVRPYGDDQWIHAKEAKYSSGLRTPMNSGYGAVKKGGTISFNEIEKYIMEK